MTVLLFVALAAVFWGLEWAIKGASEFRSITAAAAAFVAVLTPKFLSAYIDMSIGPKLSIESFGRDLFIRFENSLGYGYFDAKIQFELVRTIYANGVGTLVLAAREIPLPHVREAGRREKLRLTFVRVPDDVVAQIALSDGELLVVTIVRTYPMLGTRGVNSIQEDLISLRARFPEIMLKSAAAG